MGTLLGVHPIVPWHYPCAARRDVAIELLQTSSLGWEVLKLIGIKGRLDGCSPNSVPKNTHRIHGTGIFTYMNGWFLWYM